MFEMGNTVYPVEMSGYDGERRIFVEFNFGSRGLVFEHATRLNLFGEERQLGRFHRSLHDALSVRALCSIFVVSVAEILRVISS
jgi:hypothetical protein